MNKRIGFLLSVLIAASLACNFSFGSSGNGGGGEDTSVLFQDDFSSTSSGWDRTTTDTGSTDYQDGGYRIYVATDYSSVWANPGRSFGDVRVEAEGHKIGGVDDNEYGVICRYEDVDNFYAASISSDGFFAIIRIIDGEFGYLGSDGMQPTDLINLGSASNTIRFDCVGSTLTLYVNGSQLISVTDSSFASGDVGLYAGTFGTPGADILFDNFVVRQP